METIKLYEIKKSEKDFYFWERDFIKQGCTIVDRPNDGIQIGKGYSDLDEAKEFLKTKKPAVFNTQDRQWDPCIHVKEYYIVENEYEDGLVVGIGKVICISEMPDLTDIINNFD